jgi:XFP N-terminal domain
MLCRVLLMRFRGRRLPWRDTQNGPVHQGELSTHYMMLEEQRYFVATLMQPGDALRREVLPRLYEPVLTTLDPRGLGYSLSHAYGAALDNPDLIVACVVGDGEAETGPLATAWHSNKFINPIRDGAVLPILSLNGYKIANPTISRAH